MSFKSLKEDIFKILKYNYDLKRLLSFPKRKVVGYLIAFLSHPDQKIKERAIISLGIIVPKIADEDMESARIIMRRLMWTLNDESGGIGWGVPEAMAEIIINHKS